MSKLLYGYCTDRGNVKEINEDSILIEKKDDRNGVFAIADGMGGHSLGDKASKLVIENLQKYYLQEEKTLDLEATTINLNEIVYEESIKNEVVMGTTLSSLLIKGHDYNICNVGDSRVYLIRDGIIKQITEDDSLVYQQYKSGVISKRQYRNSDKKNILLKSLGTEEEVNPSIYAGPLKANDLFLLSCDGLHNEFKEEELASIVLDQIKGGKALGDIAVYLVEEAKRRKSKDNISVILIWNREESEALKGFSKLKNTLKNLIG